MRTNQAKVSISDREHARLIEVFAKFLTLVTHQGADAEQLETLLTVLRSADENDEVVRDLEALTEQVKRAIASVAPRRLTLVEAAEAFEVNAQTLRRACWQGTLPAEKQGKTWFVRPADVERFLPGIAKRRIRR